MQFVLDIKKVEGTENSYTLILNQKDNDEEDNEPTALNGQFKDGSLVFELSEAEASVVIKLTMEDKDNMNGNLSLIYKYESGSGEMAGSLTAVRMAGN